MTAEVTIKLKPSNVLPDVWDWLHEQGWNHDIDWGWRRTNSSDPSLDNRYTFRFEKEEYATLFALKWT
jgi:hypothetical protein